MRVPTALGTRIGRRPLLWAAGAAVGAVAVLVTDPTRPDAPDVLPCPFRSLTGFDCPLCGATRATAALVHLEPVRALGYNALWLAFVPLATWAWMLDARGRFDGSTHPFRRRAFWWAAGAAALVFTVVRNLPWAPWQALGTG